MRGAPARDAWEKTSSAPKGIAQKAALAASNARLEFVLVTVIASMTPTDDRIFQTLSEIPGQAAPAANRRRPKDRLGNTVEPVTARKSRSGLDPRWLVCGLGILQTASEKSGPRPPVAQPRARLYDSLMTDSRPCFDPSYWHALVAREAGSTFGRAIQFLIDNDPEVLEAVNDVAGTLIDCWLRMTPAARMAYAIGTARGIERACRVER